MPINRATPGDIPQLEALLNSAYRGERSKQGWTTEADLIEGDQRTDAEALNKLLQTPGAIFLKYINEQGQVEGCVFLQKNKSKLYLGMLSVSPMTQAKGIGKQLMEAAEEHAKELACSSIYMKVISVRHELVAWYERKGYTKTGATEPFPVDNNFGTAVLPLEFVIMEKAI